MEALKQRLCSGVTDDALALLHNLYCKAASADAGWYIGKSDLAGRGIFAARDYESGDKLGVAMVDGGQDELGVKIWNLTEMARYCNHQQKANAKLVKDAGVYYLVATQPIKTDDEIFADYAQTTRVAGPHSRMLWNGVPIPTTDLSDFKVLPETKSSEKKAVESNR